MTREELMEECYRKNPKASAGDLALALSRRFPKCQGNRVLKNGERTMSHIQMATEFLKKKHLNKNTKRHISDYELRGELYPTIMSLSSILCNAFKNVLREHIGQQPLNTKVNLIIPKEAKKYVQAA